MTGHFRFDFPAALFAGLPLVFVTVWLGWKRLTSHSTLRSKVAGTLISLRFLGLLAAVLMIARPVWVREDPSDNERPIALLLDRSQSMSLVDGEGSRYQHMLTFLRDHLLPAVKKEKLHSEAFLFAADATRADGEAVVNAIPDGSKTDLAEGIQQAVSAASRPPLAVIALTDGASNQNDRNSRALAALLDAGSPFIGVGIGDDQGVSTMNLRRLDAPAFAPPNQFFSIGVQLEATTSKDVPAFQLSLFRDGKLLEARQIPGFSGSRFWLETFRIKESEEGVHQFAAHVDLPSGSPFVYANRSASAMVRISAEKEVRVLFAQSALTWDFKFIARALQDDPTMKLTGLSRTSEHSIFRQNVEAAGELLDGFPEKLEQMAPFRVVVLSDLQPQDFNAAQQETLARFCRELGGGVLLIGGQSTFGPAWRGSVLEQLLPVEFDANPGVSGLDQPFHFVLTKEALRHPAFQITSPIENQVAWEKIPAFNDYGRVEKIKPGATILAEHERDRGPDGKRILMATQHYGAGISSVLCVQNFWRWRLAKDADPEQFDRFWRQYLRWLGETSRQPVEISFPGQDLKVGNRIQFVVESTPGTNETSPLPPEITVQVLAPDSSKALDQKVNLTAGHAETLTFTAEKEGIYQVRAVGVMERELASRGIEIKDINVEFQQTARDMENLRQWAAMTGGLAVKIEECDEAGMVRELLSRVEHVRETRRLRTPLGINPWTFFLCLGPLAAEWILRRKWNLQ